MAGTCSPVLLPPLYLRFPTELGSHSLRMRYEHGTAPNSGVSEGGTGKNAPPLQPGLNRPRGKQGVITGDVPPCWLLIQLSTSE